MGTTPAANFSRRFDLDAGRGILTDDSAAFVEVSAATDADVVDSIRSNSSFPTRPNGKLELGRIQLTADAGRDVAFKAGQTQVQFRASAGAAAGIGIYDQPSDALAAIGLEDTPGPDFSISPSPAHRYLLLSCGYNVAGSVAGGHPIGAVGTLSFGIEAQREARYAVLHRFPQTQGSHDVIRKAVGSWRLPRHVRDADELAPGTWLVAETDGHISIDIAAQIGYDFTFVRELESIGLTGDIGFKIDAAARATLGFEVSGHYLVMLGREDESPASQKLRLRLFKLNKKGHSFGLNMAVGVKGITEALPGSVDDLIKAVFGVHGRQVVKDLLVIEKWTDPNSDLSDTVATLANDTGLDLLRKVTGIDPETAFNEARDKLLGALRIWDSLPERAAAATWRALERTSGKEAELKRFRKVVEALADPNEKQRAKKLAGFITAAVADRVPEVPVIGSVESEWLSAIAERGLLSLMDRLTEVNQTAVLVEQVLNGGVIRQLQSYISERLDLEKLRNAPTFDQVDSWLVARLSRFLDERLKFEKLDDLKKTINTLVLKRHEFYEAAKKALERRYSFDLAATYSKTTAKTALLDVEFDLSEPECRDLLAQVLEKGKMDELLTRGMAGVTLHEAMLTHSVDRRTSVELNMPMLSSRREHINTSLAKVSARDDGERVLVYELDASDVVTVRNRLRSQLAVAGAFPLGANVRGRSTEALTWSYQYVAVQENMRRADLEDRIVPFIQKYLPDQFAQGGPSSLDTWITDFDRAVEEVVHNGTNEFGDTILNMEVSLPARALASWFQPRSDSQLQRDSMHVSRRIQASLKQLVPFYFLQDLKQLRQNPTIAALLTWAAIPPSSSVRLSNGTLALDTEEAVFWNHPDPQIRRAMAASSATAARLAISLAACRKRLLEAGETREADFFVPSEAADFQSMAVSGSGETLLSHLLLFEARVIEQAVEALRDVGEFMAAASSSPTKAIERLAEMGAEITDAFHGRLSSVYGKDSLRTLGSLIFLESACALDPSLRNARPNALIRITVLQENRTFQIKEYLNGAEPSREDVALVQTLAAVAA